MFIIRNNKICIGRDSAIHKLIVIGINRDEPPKIKLVDMQEIRQNIKHIERQSSYFLIGTTLKNLFILTENIGSYTEIVMTLYKRQKNKVAVGGMWKSSQQDISIKNDLHEAD